MESNQSDILLHSSIKSHDTFFSSIISMIPRDLYQPEEEGLKFTSFYVHTVSNFFPI